jgi:hypothetical protein
LTAQRKMPRMAAPDRADGLAEARLALREAEERRDAADWDSDAYHLAVRQVGHRWLAVRRLVKAGAWQDRQDD